MSSLRNGRSMGRFFDFAKRRIAGYIIFWFLVLLLAVLLFQGDTPAQGAWLVVFGIAFIGSLLYTRRMKRNQLARRAAKEQAQRMQQWQQWQQAQWAYQMQQMRTIQQAPQTPPAQPTQPPQPPGGR